MYAYGVRVGFPSLFFVVPVFAGCVNLVLFQWLEQETKGGENQKINDKQFAVVLNASLAANGGREIAEPSGEPESEGG